MTFVSVNLTNIIIRNDDLRYKYLLNAVCFINCKDYLTILLGSTPQLAAIITFGSACSIRTHSSLTANPKIAEISFTTLFCINLNILKCIF